MRPLIDHGHIYLPNPSIRVIGSKTHWVSDDREKDKRLKKFRSSKTFHFTIQGPR